MPEQAKIAHKFMTLELEGGVACGICAAKRGSFSGAKKKEKKYPYLLNTIYSVKRKRMWHILLELNMW